MLFVPGLLILEGLLSSNETRNIGMGEGGGGVWGGTWTSNGDFNQRQRRRQRKRHQKVNSRCFKLRRSYSNCFNLSDVGDFVTPS